jgi:predicted transcriptional regulator
MMPHNIVKRRFTNMKHLAKLRSMAGKSQWWLAAETGIDRSFISLIEHGHVIATAEQEAAISKALLAAMRQNVAEFSRLAKVGIERLIPAA